MKTFVTGATGFIGSQLCLKLAGSGHQVHALYRSESKAIILRHPDIHLFKGDILDYNSLKNAMTDCQQIYHMAAFTKVWVKDESRIYELNVTGTLNVLNAAMETGIKDIVISSTAGVFGPSLDGNEVSETSIRQIDFFIEYERTKAIAEEMALEFLKSGLNIRIVNPTRVYGPGVLNPSNSVTKLIAAYMSGTWRIIPGDGNSVGNYVFIDDAVNGHVLAMEKGKPGEKYLLGGENISYNDFFKLLGEISGKRRLMLKVPLSPIYFASDLAMLVNRLTGVKPFITKGLMRKFNYNWRVNSLKAMSEIGYTQTPLKECLTKTIDWIKNNGKT
ncbi:MAG: SDR family oxidoreductase [Bacteroidales bacterium]|nr:SDR family oxidoreductase [Bacteroidales bacterium]